MMLALLIIWLLIGASLAGFAGLRSSKWPRWISVITLGSQVMVLVAIWIQYLGKFGLSTQGPWLVEFSRPWIPQFGISFHLAMDGLSLLLVLLTDFLGLMAVAASWVGIQERVGFFHFNLLWISAALVGVFLALDLFLFYFFWEMMLVPLYFLIGIWGHENRIYATLKFFIFTQISGLLMLLAIVGLYFLHGRSTGVYTFNYLELLGTSMTPAAALGLMLGFFAAFAVKLPVVPVHTWLPDAHTEAPTAGSVILAGLVLKAGAYGMLRFMIPLFPEAALRFAPLGMALAVIGIIYGAVLAFAQTDLKRLVAYTSVSHMGFVLLGVFAWNQLALQGAVMIILAHALSTGALFILVGDLQDRIHTRDLDRMGGLWSTLPRMGGVGLVLALASLGLPGLVNFVGEFLVLLGALQVNVAMTALATIGFVVSTVYALWMMQRTFYGRPKEEWKVPDFGGREMTIMVVMLAIIVFLGLYPQPVLNTAARALETLQEYAGMPSAASAIATGAEPIWHPVGDATAIRPRPLDGGSP
jgi:NADH-quinone oxidoreductase subunit M